jgi:hypothetical protein
MPSPAPAPSGDTSQLLPQQLPQGPIQTTGYYLPYYGYGRVNVPAWNYGYAPAVQAGYYNAGYAPYYPAYWSAGR